jgi:hypothetical protein
MPENHLNFVYTLDGDVDEIDVFQLAPTLLALGELIQQGNRTLFPNGREVAVNCKPFREGSFIVDLTLFPSTELQQLLDFIKPHSLEQLKTLLEVIGLIATGTAVSVVSAVKAIQYLGGKPKTIEEVKPGEYRLSIDDKSITVGGNVNTLLANPTITNNLYKIYVPLESQGKVTDVKTYLRGEEANAVTVERNELSSFKEYAAPPETPVETKETTTEQIHEGVFLNPKRGAFGNDPKDWSFWRGQEVLTATIKDQHFLEQIESGDIRLNDADLLTVRLLERQKVKGTLVQKPTYEVLEVTHYEKGHADST